MQRFQIMAGGIGLLLSAICISPSLSAEAKPTEPPPKIPDNLDVITVSTVSKDNPMVPFYIRKPKNFDPKNKERYYRILYICPFFNGDGLKIMQNDSPLQYCPVKAFRKRYNYMTIG